MSGAPVLLYDSDCGFCRWALGWVLRWDREARIEPVALQDRRADVLLAALDPDVRMSSWHLVSDGELRSGGAAAAPLARMLPAGGALARVFDAAPSVVDRAYRRIAGARNKLGPRIPRSAIAKADELIAARQAARPGSGLA